MSRVNETPRLDDVKRALIREAELTLPPGTALLPAALVADVERRAQVWVAACMIQAGSSATDMVDELGISLPSLHLLKRDPEVVALVSQLRADVDRAVQDKLAFAALRRIDALETIGDDTNVGAEHRVKANLGIVSAYQDRAAKDNAKAGTTTTNIAVILNQASEKMRDVPVVELEDIRVVK